MLLKEESFEITLCPTCANYYVNTDASAYESEDELPTPYDWVTVDIDSGDDGGNYYDCDGCDQVSLGLRYPATVETFAG